MTIDRRRFLQLTTAGVLASVTASACVSDEAVDEREVAQPALLGMLGTVGVRQLGVRYREMVPKENDEAALRAAISDGGRIGLRFPWTARPSLANQVRTDFAEGRTIIVNGWVLSTTEARQCALFSLRPA
jgi:hypothetical protein